MMQTVRQINLSDHPMTFRVSEDAYEVLKQYLENAKLRLKDDPDYEDVLHDLEQSIGEKLAVQQPTADAVVTLDDIKSVLGQVGPVDSGSNFPDVSEELPRSQRRLYRIKEGQDIFGVCQGVSAYSDINVDWVRTIFLALAAVTGGIFLLVYLGMGFFLPVVATREEYFALNKAIQKS